MVEFVIPQEPFGKQRPRFSRGRTYTPKKTADYEGFVRLCYCKAANDYMCGAVRATITAVHEMPSSWSEKKRSSMDGAVWAGKPDADNIAKSVLDALNGVAYGDDSQVVDLHVIKRYGYRGYVVVQLEAV